MTTYEAFYVDKGLNPFADLLTTYGLTRVLSDTLSAASDRGYQLEIEDKGRYYQIRPKSPIQREGLLPPRTPQHPIRTPKTKLPEEIAAYDYEADKALVTAYFEARRHKVEAPPPPAHWDVLRAINPAALPGYNSLMLDWYTVSAEPEVLAILLDLFASTPNPVEAIAERWKQLDKARGWGIKPFSTAQQLYNPDSGKGQNRSKADGLAVGNVDQFWLIEWLKAVGFYEGALTRLVRGAKDRKTFVLAPRELTWQTHSQVMGDFIQSMQVTETATRFDCLAVLRYTRALLSHLMSNESSQLARFRQRLNIRKSLVSGFYTAFYKDMGNAVATMNMAFIALPGWITVEDFDDATLYINLLKELETFTQQFDESHSDAFTLLQHLRDFLSGDDLRAFFRFTNAFPAYLMGKRERNQYARQFSTDFIERLIMSTEQPLAPILASEGFQRIAYAIRQSTVTAQYRKKQGDRKYDVRYGLGQELTRKARYKADFITALSQFILDYNAENAQVIETRPAPYRSSVRTSDIDQIVALMDEYGSQTVANLLIAYGYARLPNEQQDPQQPIDGSTQDEESN
jgi:hypothetical protein